MSSNFKIFIEYYNIKKYSFYLYYLNSRLCRCTSVYELYCIFKNINFFYPHISSDNLLTILTECVKKYPLSIEKIQYFSTLQQEYSNQNGIEGYITIVIWMAIIQSINEQPKIK